MDSKQIFFTGKHKAELLTVPVPQLKKDEVLTKTEYTVISGGTERANIMGMQNTYGDFPKSLGYCGIGRVVKTGEDVTGLEPGDRVLVYHGFHSEYNVRPVADIADGRRARVGFRRQICARAASKPLTIRKVFSSGFSLPEHKFARQKLLLQYYFNRLYLLHCTRRNFRVIFRADEAALRPPGNEDKRKSAENSPCAAARFAFR